MFENKKQMTQTHHLGSFQRRYIFSIDNIGIDCDLYVKYCIVGFLYTAYTEFSAGLNAERSPAKTQVNKIKLNH